MIVEREGNIFTTQAKTIVNTVNCVGVMGAGIAFEFRLRYPDMYAKYQKFCDEGLISIGKLWRYKAQDREILAFPTKYDWRYPSEEIFLHKGLEKFLATYRSLGIESIAFPILGADKGGIETSRALEIMYSYLKDCDIDIEIWHFDPTAKDDKYELFKAFFESFTNEEISKEIKNISSKILNQLRQAIDDPSINSLNGLLSLDYVGERTIEKLFAYIELNSKDITSKKDRTLLDDLD